MYNVSFHCKHLSIFIWSELSVNGKFAGQLTVIQDQFGVADNILQVSNLSLKCLVKFLDHLGKIQIFHL